MGEKKQMEVYRFISHLFLLDDRIDGTNMLSACGEGDVLISDPLVEIGWADRNTFILINRLDIQSTVLQ